MVRDFGRSGVFLLFAFGIVNLISVVSAFDVTQFYFDTRPLELSPGESRETSLILRNFDEPEGVSDFVEASFVDDVGIASFVDSDLTYEVPFGGEHVNVPLMISIPEDAEIGETLEIKVLFSDVSSSGGGEGNVNFVVNLVGEVIVEIVEDVPLQPEEVSDESDLGSVLFWGVVGFLVLGIFVVVYGIRRIVGKRKNMV
jgi:hypothetical protein